VTNDRQSASISVAEQTFEQARRILRGGFSASSPAAVYPKRGLARVRIGRLRQQRLGNG
jgi:hypothetical protein